MKCANGILSDTLDHDLKATISSQIELVASTTKVSIILANIDIQKFIYKVNCVVSH